MLPRILSCGDAGQNHGLADRCNRDGRRVRCSAGQLVGQLLASVRHRAVQQSRRRKAEADAAHRLQRHRPILLAGAGGDAECPLDITDMPATIGCKACCAFADADVPPTPPRPRQIVVERCGAVHRCNRDIQLGGRGALVDGRDSTGSYRYVLQSLNGRCGDGHPRLLLRKGPWCHF